MSTPRLPLPLVIVSCNGLVVHVVEVLLLSLNGLEVAPVSPVLEAVRV